MAEMYKELEISGIKQHTEDFKVFEFSGEKIPYKAGQYLTLSFQDNLEEIRRPYSIVSIPETDKKISIGVKRIPNGVVSRKLVDDAKIGDKIITTGAGGLFVLPDNLSTVKDCYFFAAGSGITPIISLIKSGLHRSHHFNARLFYSNRSEGSTAFFYELSALENQFTGRFKVDFLYSSNPNLLEARLDRERILKILSTITDKENCLFFICGPAAYMRMITFILIENGIPAGNIRKEDFLPQRTNAFIPEPPDKTPRMVTLHANGQIYYFEAAYPDTILKAAKKQQIPLPYSCESGKCGNCVAKCLEGTVWMNNNEVLLDADLKKGLVLTCTGHPINGSVVLDFNL